MANENVRPSELAGRQNKKVMMDCVEALGDYAALLVNDGNGTSTPAKKLREIVSDAVPYWGLDADDDGMSVEAYLRNFDNKVHDARISPHDCDTFSICSDLLTGLAQYGEDMVNAQGSDAMKEILQIADLLEEVGEYFGFSQETEFANGSARWLRNSVKGMLRGYDLPGHSVEDMANQGYSITQSVLFDNNMGYAVGYNHNAASPYVSWQIYNNNGNPEFEWGNYFNSEEKALVDYIERHKQYVADNKVKEVSLPFSAEQELDEWRTYKAEIALPDMEYPHLEVFGADNDVDAVNQAHELCNEMKNSYLLEVHELNENYDSIRQIDLRFHDPDARRFMDVDILDFLGKIAEKTIIHHPSDFKIDVDALWKAAISQNPEDKRFMWHCCSYGTHILPETEVFTKSTGAFGYWVDYRPKEPDMVGFAVEVTGYRGETVVGNVYDVGNYYDHSLYVKENSAVLDSVSLTYSNEWGINAGKTVTVSRHQYDQDRHRIMTESGNVTLIKYHPSEATITMADRIKAEQAKYMGMSVGDIAEYLMTLDKKLLEQRGEPQNNLRIYHADFNDPEISERMEIIAAVDDADALQKASEICAESDGIVLVELNEVLANEEMRKVPLPSQEAEIMTDPAKPAQEKSAEKPPKPKRKHRGESL